MSDKMFQAWCGFMLAAAFGAAVFLAYWLHATRFLGVPR